MKIVTISPKGQITIPQDYRQKIKTNHCIFEMEGTVITLKPIKIEILNETDELDNFGMLAEKSFDFWDNPEDDIYDKFYNKK